jgi:pyrimidine deaminase RibD-like protein
MITSLKWHLRSLEKAHQSTAFNVGCVITLSEEPYTIVATGYSRELPGNTHAEECALEKLPPKKNMRLTLYTTLEPCSSRLSNRRSCASRIIADSMISVVVIGAREPPDFVKCEGTQQIQDHWIDVRYTSSKSLSALF